MTPADEDVEAIWPIGVFDAHCHPTDIMASLEDIPQMNAQTLTVMATRRDDQALVEDVANKFLLPDKSSLSNASKRIIVPAFGWHPWFSHQMYDDRGTGAPMDRAAHYKTVLTPSPDDEEFLDSIPEPLSLSEFLKQTEKRLVKFPYALVGEIGLDRSFRLPRAGFIPAGDMTEKTGGSKEDYTPGSREGRPLTPYRVSLDHQKVILKAQLELAGTYQRPVSVHSVQTHGAVFDVLQELWKGHERPSKRERKRKQSHPDAGAPEDTLEAKPKSPPPFPPRICMHSYSGPPDALSQFLAKTVPADIYFSFSICINFSTPAAQKAEAVIKAVPEDRILVESDFHCAGEKMDELLRDIVVKVCQIKGWELLDGARQLRRNWERFVFGEDQAVEQLVAKR